MKIIHQVRLLVQARDVRGEEKITTLPTAAMALARAMIVVRSFYAALLFLFVSESQNWQGWLHCQTFLLLWPVKFIAMTGSELGVGVVLATAMAGALAAMCWPGMRWARALAALGTLWFGALWNSFGSVTHGWHGWIWVSLLFVLLPDGNEAHIAQNRVRRMRYLRVFFGAQVALGLFYSMSGGFKLIGAVWQALRHQPNAFLPDALPRFIAQRLLEGAPRWDFAAGPWLIEHRYVAWVVYLSAIHLESMSLIAVFRPALHRVWGIGLILFQLGVFFALTILFSWQVLLLGLMLVCSPFAPTRVSVARVVRSLPVVGDGVMWVRRRPRDCARRTSAASYARPLRGSPGR